MAENDTFKNQKKLRKAKIVTLPNTIKKKVGSGGLDEATIARAELVLESNTIDFKPIAAELLNDLNDAIQTAADNPMKSDEAIIEAMLFPAAQFKTLGMMFHFPLVSEISDILIDFLETVEAPASADALEIATAHKIAIAAAIDNDMTGTNPPQGAELKRTLIDACGRYYKKIKS